MAYLTKNVVDNELINVLERPFIPFLHLI